MRHLWICKSLSFSNKSEIGSEIQTLQLWHFLCTCLLVCFGKCKCWVPSVFYPIIITMFPFSYSVHGVASGTEVCALTRTLRYHVRSQMLNTLSDDLLLSANIRRLVIICDFDLIHCSKLVLDISIGESRYWKGF